MAYKTAAISMSLSDLQGH